MNIFDNELERLDFEDFIWVIFIILSLLNIFGDNLLKEFIKNKDKTDEVYANKIFFFVLIISLFIYIYFFIRNLNAYNKVNEEEKQLFLIKLIGSSLLIAGICCLIYFQYKNTDFIGAPVI
ncbi:MAG: oligosaccharide flippase family protein [Bacilli bacterium]|nr:oligosaccharide flippase family protein [Bacilli bacterium]